MQLLKRSCIGFLALGLVFLTGYQPVKAAGATLYLSPPTGGFTVDSTFDVSVLMNTAGQSVNAVSLEITFPPQMLQVVKPVPDSSVIAMWIAQPSFSNTEGKIHIEGGIPNPGINSSAANILGITFRAKQAGQAKIQISEGARILANDGTGTNIIGGQNGSTINISAKPPEGPTISSDTHPDQNSWYQNNAPQFSWLAKESVSALSWNFDQSPNTEPDTTAEELSNTISTQAPEDGIWYFHLRVQSNKAWGGTSHYSVRVDKTAPAAFTPVIEPEDVLPGQKPVATFTTTDRTSGVDHYEIKVESLEGEGSDASFFTEQQSPYILPEMKKGRYQVTVRAFDKAGNTVDGTTQVNVTDQAVAVTVGEKPVNISFTSIAALAGGIFVFILAFWLLFRRRRKKVTVLPPVSPVPAAPALGDVERQALEMPKEVPAVQQVVPPPTPIGQPAMAQQPQLPVQVQAPAQPASTPPVSRPNGWLES